MASVIRVAIADDHGIVRSGIANFLRSQPGIHVVGEAADGSSALGLVATYTLDVLVLDLALPELDGFEVLARVRKIAPALAVVVLTMYPEDQMGWHLLELGASAYLNKTRSPEELLRAIHSAASGKPYLTEDLSRLQLESGQGHNGGPPHHRLTSREYSVFLALIGGRPVKQIAEELGLAASTVSNHVAAIRDKLGAASIAEVVVYAHRAGLL